MWECGGAPQCGHYPSGFLPGNGDGTFQEFSEITSPALGTYAAADLNKDGRTDLVILDRSGQTVYVMLNTTQAKAAALASASGFEIERRSVD